MTAVDVRLGVGAAAPGGEAGGQVTPGPGTDG